MSLCEPIRCEIEKIESELINSEEFSRAELDSVRAFALNWVAYLPSEKFYGYWYDEDEDREVKVLNEDVADLVFLWKELRKREVEAMKELKP